MNNNKKFSIKDDNISLDKFPILIHETNIKKLKGLMADLEYSIKDSYVNFIYKSTKKNYSNDIFRDLIKKKEIQKILKICVNLLNRSYGPTIVQKGGDQRAHREDYFLNNITPKINNAKKNIKDKIDKIQDENIKENLNKILNRYIGLCNNLLKLFSVIPNITEDFIPINRGVIILNSNGKPICQQKEVYDANPNRDIFPDNLEHVRLIHNDSNEEFDTYAYAIREDKTEIVLGNDVPNSWGDNFNAYVKRETNTLDDYLSSYIGTIDNIGQKKY